MKITQLYRAVLKRERYVEHTIAAYYYRDGYLKYRIRQLQKHLLPDQIVDTLLQRI